MFWRAREAGAKRQRPPLVVQELSPAQRSLVDLMHVQQFGRIENMPVRAGGPILNSDVKAVRVVRLGPRSGAAKVAHTDEFELNKSRTCHFIIV
jgi:hypothetical protein